MQTDEIAKYLGLMLVGTFVFMLMILFGVMSIQLLGGC